MNSSILHLGAAAYSLGPKFMRLISENMNCSRFLSTNPSVTPNLKFKTINVLSEDYCRRFHFLSTAYDLNHVGLIGPSSELSDLYAIMGHTGPFIEVAGQYFLDLYQSEKKKKINE